MAKVENKCLRMSNASSRKIIKELRDAGAALMHVAYGIDVYQMKKGQIVFVFNPQQAKESKWHYQNVRKNRSAPC